VQQLKHSAVDNNLIGHRRGVHLLFVNRVQRNAFTFIKHRDCRRSTLAHKIPQAMFKNAFGDCVERFEGMIAVARSKIVKMNNRLASCSGCRVLYHLFGNARFVEVEFSSFEGVTIRFESAHHADGIKCFEPKQPPDASATLRGFVVGVQCLKRLHILIVETDPVVGDFESDNILMGIRPSFLFGIV